MTGKGGRRRNRKAKAPDARARLAAKDGHTVTLAGPAACCPAEVEFTATGRVLVRHDDDCVILTDPSSDAATRARVVLNAAVTSELERVTGQRTVAAVQGTDGRWQAFRGDLPGLRIERFEMAEHRTTGSGPYADAIERVRLTVQAGKAKFYCDHLTGDMMGTALLATGVISCRACFPAAGAQHNAANPDTCDACGLIPADGMFRDVASQIAGNLFIAGNICDSCHTLSVAGPVT